MMYVMETYATNLESLVSAKTELLRDEKKKTEELLYQMLPKSVSHSLSVNSEHSISTHLFCDQTF